MSPYGPTLSCRTLSPDPMAWAPHHPNNRFHVEMFMMLRQRYTRRYEVAPVCIMFQTNNPGAWSEIGADHWVKTIAYGGT